MWLQLGPTNLQAPHIRTWIKKNEASLLGFQLALWDMTTDVRILDEVTVRLSEGREIHFCFPVGYPVAFSGTRVIK